MEYVTKKCPHCNYPYTVLESKGAGYYGSPVRTCNKCGQTFIDKDYREIAIQGIREIDTQKISARTILFLIIGIFFGVGIFYLFDVDVISVIVAIIAVLLPTLNLISEYRNYGKRQAYLTMEKINSERRLENHEYAVFLKSLGYDVPKKYLEQNEKNITSEPKTYSTYQDGTWICNIRR